MKFQFPSLKTTGQLLLALLAAIAAGTVMLTLSYTIPTDKINENVEASAYILNFEGTYPSLDNSYISKLDNYTDALMLREAAYSGDESAFQKAMLCPSSVLAESSSTSPIDKLVELYTSPQADRTVSTYATYWHGYLIFLKPLLLFLSYGKIRNINWYIQLLLSTLILILLVIRKNWQLIPACIATALMMRPGLSAYSLQHSTIYYIILVASILLLLFGEKLKSGNGLLIFFLLLGAATSYFDYLTYPLVSFGIPAALTVFISRKDKYSDLRIVLNLLICWGIGYVGMWASKWLLATAFTEQNIIETALESIRLRSGSSNGENTFTYMDTLHSTFLNFVQMPYTVIYLVILAIEVIAFIFLHKKNPLKESISFIFIMLLPLLWYAFTINHSIVHCELFTYKEWAMTAFALLALFANIEFIPKQKHSDKHRH